MIRSGKGVDGHKGDSEIVKDGAQKVISAHQGETVDLPDTLGDLRDLELTRDGQDLVLEAPDGTVLIIDGYFSAIPQPQIMAEDGQVLTPELVNSFARSAPEFAQAGTMDDVSPVGVIEEASGSATVTRTDGTVETISIGMPIFQGDIVETEGDGAVNIIFIDETSFAVSDNARLAIDEYVFDPATESGSSNFSMLRGVFVFTSGLIGRDDPDDVEIDTPVGSIGIRGTTIAGNVDTGEITVVDGAIVLRSHTGEEMTLALQFETGMFNPQTGEITHMGQMDAQSMGAKFAAIGGVTPTFFNALGNEVQEGGNEGEGATGEEGTREGAAEEGRTEGAAEENATDEAGEEGTEEAGSEETAPEQQAETEPGTEPAQTAEGGEEGALPPPPPPSPTPSGENVFGSTTTGSSGSTNTGSTSGAAGDPAGTTDTGSTGGTGDTSITSNSQDSDSTGSNAEPPPPPLLPLELTISRQLIDDNLAVGDVIAVIETTGDFPDVSYTLLNDNGGMLGIVDGPGDQAFVKLISGALTSGDVLDVDVRATLPDGRSVTEFFLVGISNLNDAPTANDGTFNIDENSAASASVGTVTASDPDAGQVLTYAITAGNTGSVFDIDSATGEITVNGTLDHEATGQYVLTVKVTDNGPGNYSDTATITIDINDVNEAPVLNDQIMATTVDEDFSNGFSVGTIAATDQDLPGDTLSYSILSGNTDSIFDIGLTSGEITIGDDTNLDYEGTQQYDLVIQVDDGNGGSDTATITVNIGDVNDNAPGLVANDGIQLSDSLDEGGFIPLTLSMLEASDVDTGDSGTLFQIDTLPGHGVLKLSGVTLAPTDTFSVQDIIDGNVTYHHDDSENFSDDFDFTLTDGTNVGSSYTFNIGINEVNDETPTLDLDQNDSNTAGTGYNASFTEDGGYIAITDADVEILDDDNGNIQSVTIQITNPQDGGAESLSMTAGGLSNIGAWSLALTPGTHSITISGTATLAQYESLLQKVLYNNTSQNPDTTDRTIEITVNDGVNDSNVAVSTVTVAGVNDKPDLTPLSPNMTNVNEDDTGNAGDTVFDIVSGSITDVDSAVNGIAVIGVDAGNGYWEYDNGSGWTAIGTPAPATALLLDSNDLIRFVPNADFDGSATFNFKAWDQTVGGSGSTWDTTTGGTAFSDNSDTATVDVLAINDAPTLANTFPSMTNINEDDFSSPGEDLDTLMGANYGDAETPGVGIAITDVDDSNGQWEYFDGTWQAISGVSSTNALLLLGTDLVRFVPNADFSGTASFDYVAWDQSVGSQYGIEDTTIGDAFSSGFDTIDIEVLADIGDVDNITGGAGADVLSGDDGDNVYDGGGGADMITAGAGNDTFTINNDDGQDNITGGAGLDTYDATGVTYDMNLDMSSFAGTTLVDQAGSDQNESVAQVETFDAGTGNDTFNMLSSSVNSGYTLNAAGGFDTLDYSAYGSGNNVNVDIVGGSVIVNSGATQTISGFEKFVGSAGDDVFEISAALFDVEDGDSVEFHLLGSGGNDTLKFTNAGAGDFIIEPEGTEDRIEGVEIYDFGSNAQNDVIDVSIRNFMLDSNSGQTLTIQIDDADDLVLDFMDAGYDYVSGTVAAGNTITFSDGTRTVNVDFGGAFNGLFDVYGLGNPGVLDLNVIAAGLEHDEGFIIVDDGTIANSGFGDFVAALGDLDGDGYDNLAFGMGNGSGVPLFDLNTDDAGGKEPLPADTVLSSLSGSFILPPDGDTSNAESVSAVGDFDGDGMTDYIVGTPSENSSAGNAKIIAEDGTLIMDLNGMFASDMTGMSVAGVGDVNGDGFADVLVGAPGRDEGFSNNGSAYLLFGGDNMPLSQHIDGLGTGIIDDMGTIGNAVAIESANGVGDRFFVISDAVGPNGQLEVMRFNTGAGFLSSDGQLDDPDLEGVVAADIDSTNQFVYTITGPGILARVDYGGGAPVLAEALSITAVASNGGGKDIVVDSLGTTAYILTANNKVVVANNIDTTIADGGTINQTDTTAITGALQIFEGAFGDIFVLYDDGAQGGIMRINTATLTNLPQNVVAATSFLKGAVDIAVEPGGNMYVLVEDGGFRSIRIYSNGGGSLGSVSVGMVPELDINLTAIDVRGNMLVVKGDDGIDGHILTFDIFTNPSNPEFISDTVEPSLFGAVDMALAGTGADLVPVTVNGAGNVQAVDTFLDGLQIDGLNMNDLLGHTVAGAGDIDGDGHGDFMIAVPTNGGGTDVGEVHLILSSVIAGQADISLAADAITIDMIDVDGAMPEIPVFNMGDINGDGVSDIAIAETAGAGALRILSGDDLNVVGAGGATAVNDTTNIMTVTAAAGFELVSAGAAGDFNGDGIDDAIIVTRNTAGGSEHEVDIYVVYGGGPGGDYRAGGPNDLDDPSIAFKMTYDIPFGDDTSPSNFDFEVSSAGDLNGDGFGDIVIGLPDLDDGGTSNAGASMVVYGHPGGANDYVYDGMFAMWKMDETSGTTVTNAVGGNPDGTWNGGASEVAAATDQIVGGALQFDGSDDYISTAQSTGIATDFTVSTWINLNSTGVRQAIISEQHGSETDFFFGINAVGQLELVIDDNSSMLTVTSAETIATGAWEHVAVSYDMAMGEYMLFINGDEVAVQNSNGISHSPAGASFNIGAHFSASMNYFDGAMDDLRIYHKSLHHEEIDHLFNNPVDEIPDQDPAMDNITAGADNQILVGGDVNNVLDDGGHMGITFLGGAGDDDFVVSDDQFKSIDGGGHMDTLKFMSGAASTLDFRNVGAEDVSRIEVIEMLGSGGNMHTLVLGINDIFSLLESSDDGSLKIDVVGNLADNHVQLATGTPTGSVSKADFEDYLGAEHLGSGSGFEHFEIGGKDLYIDMALFNSSNMSTIV